MSDPNNRLPINAPGNFYVDDTCIDCDMCRSTAPAIFARDAENASSYVMRQPGTPEEVALAKEAREGCPTESIGEENGF